MGGAHAVLFPGRALGERHDLQGLQHTARRLRLETHVVVPKEAGAHGVDERHQARL